MSKCRSLVGIRRWDSSFTSRIGCKERSGWYSLFPILVKPQHCILIHSSLLLYLSHYAERWRVKWRWYKPCRIIIRPNWIPMNSKSNKYSHENEVTSLMECFVQYRSEIETMRRQLATHQQDLRTEMNERKEILALSRHRYDELVQMSNKVLTVSRNDLFGTTR